MSVPCDITKNEKLDKLKTEEVYSSRERERDQKRMKRIVEASIRMNKQKQKRWNCCIV